MANTPTCPWHDANGINRSFLIKDGVQVFNNHQPIRVRDKSQVMLVCNSCQHNGKITILNDAFSFTHSHYGHPLKAFSIKLYGSDIQNERVVLEIARQDGVKVDVFFRRIDGCLGKTFPMTVVKNMKDFFKHFPRDRAPQRPRLVVKFPSVPIPQAPGDTVHARRRTAPCVEIPVLHREQAFSPEILDRIEVRMGLAQPPQPSSEEHPRTESVKELRHAARTPGLFVTPGPMESRPSTAAPRSDKASGAEAMTQRGTGSSFTPLLRQLEVANQSANIISRSIRNAARPELVLSTNLVLRDESAPGLDSGLDMAAEESKVRANTTDAVNGASVVKNEVNRPTDMKTDAEAQLNEEVKMLRRVVENQRKVIAGKTPRARVAESSKIIMIDLTED